jgi:hypothetical protein
MTLIVHAFEGRKLDLTSPCPEKVRLIYDGVVSKDEMTRLEKFACDAELEIVVGHDYPKKVTADLWRRFPRVRGFELYQEKFKDVAVLESLPEDLSSLALGGYSSGKLSVRFLERFGGLQHLSLARDVQELDTVQKLQSLESLALDKVSISPDIPAALPRLNKLSLMHGSMADPSALGRCKCLGELQLYRVRQLDQLDFLSSLTALRRLDLGALAQAVHLPSLKPLRELQFVHLEQLAKLESLLPVKDAPSLCQLHIERMNQIPESDYEAFKSHPSLIELTPGYGSRKKNEHVQTLLGLPHVTYPQPPGIG